VIDFEKMRQRSWEDLRKNKLLLYQKLIAAKQKKQEAA
jgi:hypothetical protein